LLGGLARDAQRGRLRLPIDELDRAKADPGVVAKLPWPREVAEIVRERYQVLRSEIADAVAKVDPRKRPALRGLLVWAALAARSARCAERALPNLFIAGRFDGLSGAWFSWRVARKATVGRFSLS
jgi:hypothetical protein